MSLVRVDCHLHTAASGDAVTTLDELAERAARESLDVVFITDHNETSAAVTAAGQKLGVRVIVGEEIRTPDGDIIGLFLTERVPYVLPVAEVVARIRSQGGLVYAPHPFDDGRSSLGRVLPGLCAAGAVDIVEVFNAKIETQGPNERALALATAYALPGGAGSDAHDPAGIGAAYLEMPDFDGPASFLAALADARKQEIERGVTLVGPHRDDLVLRLGQLPAKGYASHGESWSYALALRLASYDLLRAEGNEPVLVLDDVFAELDARRRERLAELVAPGEQVLVTAAVDDDVPGVLAGTRFVVADGAVERA